MAEKYPWGRAGSALAVIAAALAGLIVATNAMTERETTRLVDRQLAAGFAAQPPRFNDQAILDALREIAPSVGPVPLGTALIVTGDPTYAVQMLVEPTSGAGATSYRVRMRNLGTSPFDGSLTRGVWLHTRSYNQVGPLQVRNPVAGEFAVPMVRPGATAERVLDFPETGPPSELSIMLRLGHHLPTARWTLS